MDSAAVSGTGVLACRGSVSGAVAPGVWASAPCANASRAVAAGAGCAGTYAAAAVCRTVDADSGLVMSTAV